MRSDSPRAALAANLVALMVALGCGSSSKAPKAPPIDVPERRATAADELLELLPAGADSILELDLARLRTNDVVGDLFSALTAESAGAGGLNLFGAGDLVVFVSYGIGDPDPERVVVIRGAKTQSVGDAHRVDDNTVVIASGDMLERIALVRAKAAPSLSETSQLLRLRALAMPKEAPGASVRLAAHLDFDARVALAKALDVDEVPVSVSVWGDVVDDLAVVALVGGENKLEGRRLAEVLGSIRGRFAKHVTIRMLGLSRLVAGAAIENRGAGARMVLLIGPRRLKRLVARLLKRLGATEAS